MYRLAVLSFCLLNSGFVKHSFASEPLPKLIKRVQPSVATIHAYDSKGRLLVQGSGFFIDSNCRFVTSRHIVHDSSRSELRLHDGSVLKIKKIIGEDAQADLSIVQVDCGEVQIQPLALQTEAPEVGESIVVVGSPLGFGASATNGIVSAVRTIPEAGEVVQITAPISPGSSGSPVFNMNGEVIGVTRSAREDGQNLNFATAASRVQKLAGPSHRLTTNVR